MRADKPLELTDQLRSCPEFKLGVDARLEREQAPARSGRRDEKSRVGRAVKSHVCAWLGTYRANRSRIRRKPRLFVQNAWSDPLRHEKRPDVKSA